MKEVVEDIFVDGFTEHRIEDGVFSCVGFQKLKKKKIAVIRLRMPAGKLKDVVGADHATASGRSPKKSGRS